MKRLARAAWLGLAVAVSLAAQQLSLGTASTQPGQPVTLSVLLASHGAPIAGLQFDLVYNTTNLAPQASTTARITSGSPNITVTSALSIVPGESVIGTGVPSGTTVVSISGTSVTLSANCTVTNAGASLTFTSLTAAAGASATAAGKGISTNYLSNGNLRVIVIGDNQEVMADGAVAVLTIQVAANATPGNYPLAFTNVFATDPNSNLIALAASGGSVTVTGAAGPLTIAGPNSLLAATVSAAYSQTVTASGGTAPYTWSATGLPSGLNIASGTGNISGIATTAAGSPFNVQVAVTDSRSATASKSYTLAVNAALVVTGPASLPPAALSVAYPATAVTATGGSGVYTWSATGLPAGLTINAGSGVITGAPTTTAVSPFNVQITVTDSNSVTATRGYTLTVSAPLSISGPALLPVGTVNVAYPSTTVTATGGSGIYTWSAAGLPAGLTINTATGAITGTPTTATGSPFTVQVTVTDSNSATAKVSYTLIVSAQSNQIPLTVSGPAALPAAILNAAYAATISAQGGSGTYTWSATGLPPGLSIGAATGAIAGTPTTAAGSPYTVQVTVTDSTGAKATRAYALPVSARLSISGPASLPAGTVNVAYLNTTLTATGGSGTYTWSATGLPPGLSIGATTGIVSGTPATSVGSPFNVLVTVTDSNSSTASISYTLTVNLAPVTLPQIVSVTNAAVGQSAVAANTWVSIYGSNFASVGFTGDWSKSIVNGKLPIALDGVSVTAGGQAAYVAYLSATQINVLLPDLGVGSLQVTVTTSAGTSAPFTVNAQQYSAAFFPWPNNQPVATHVDYTPAVKNGTFAGTPTVPAKPGEVIILWGTGFGPTNPPAPFGVPIPAIQTFYTADPATVTIGNIAAPVSGIALTPGSAGLYQLVLTVPASMPNGDYTVIASINGAQTPAATLTVQN